MVYKLFIKLILLIALTSCGYSPIYSSLEDQRLNIEILEHEGDRQINLEIISKLNFHDNEQSDLIKLSINTYYKKNDLTKSLTGEIEQYQIEAQTTYSIITKSSKKTFTNTETFIMKNLDDDFEERNYEKKMKSNIADLNYRKLMTQLQRLK